MIMIVVQVIGLVVALVGITRMQYARRQLEQPMRTPAFDYKWRELRIVAYEEFAMGAVLLILCAIYAR